MTQLFLTLFERLGIFAIVFILMLRFDVFKRLLTGSATRYEKFSLAVFFGVFGIVGTYLGVPINNAIANSRVVGVALGGILGGPLVGLFSGLIAGGHRYIIDIGGFTAIACGVATISEGFIGSLIYHRIKKKTFDSKAAFITGIMVEILQMLIILAIAKPFSEAVHLVNVIAVPMIFVNSIGLALFVELVESVFREQEKVGALQAQTALNIAVQTLPFLRNGLNFESANETAKIILKMTNLDAIAITDESKILAHMGIASDHHKSETPILTNATKFALLSGKIVSPGTKAEIGCRNSGCRLGSAIIVPLVRFSRVVGTLKLYRGKERGISPLDMELANGLAHLFSNQLELADVENQRKLLSDAEIKALQSQINPHFLFNAINTIVSFTRTNTETASELLIKLANFFRKNINPGHEKVDLITEIEHCKDYLAIETARFEDRVKINFEIDENTVTCKLPPLILQPLVENALRHGILPKEEGGVIIIGSRKENNNVRVFVKDNGIGISDMEMSLLCSSDYKSKDGAGIAIKNVNARLKALYGTEHMLKISTVSNEGTEVSFTIPEDREIHCVKNVFS